MKALVFNGAKEGDIKKLLEGYGFEIVDRDPEIIVSYGGDGTLMRAEQAFPNVPKLPLRGSMICKLCHACTNEQVLDHVAKGEYKIEEYWKLEVRAKGNSINGMNDITVHNADPRHAIRYELFINEKKVGHEIIGDGIVVATPFGSTGYYRSITDSYFELGMGIAFNNSTEQSDHVVVKEDSMVRVRIARGPAIVYVDNREERITLDEGDEVVIRKSDAVAKILRVV